MRRFQIMKNLILILTIAVFSVVGCRAQQESSYRAGFDFSTVNKVAIVSVEGALPSEAAKDEIADFFAIELLEQGYAPMGRAQVRASLAEEEENDEEIMDLTTPERAVAVGHMLNVPAVLAVRIPHFDQEISITATMIDVDDGSILWLAKGDGKGGGSFSSIFRSKSDSSDDALLAPVLGDSMGESNEPLTPDEAERAQRIIQKMCRSLPTNKMLKAPEW